MNVLVSKNSLTAIQEEGKLLSLVQLGLVAEQEHIITFMTQGVLPLKLA